MAWMWMSVGVALVLVALVDVFFTVLNYDGFGFLSSRLYRVTWTGVRWTTTPLPRGLREFLRSIAAPLMVPVTLIFWGMLAIAGFGSLYYAGIGRFSFTGEIAPSFPAALYLSGVTLSTLGYGDITPSDVRYGALAVVQALIGFSVLTLVVSYVMNINQAVQRLHMLAARIHHQAADTADPLRLLAPHFDDGSTRGLASTIDNLYDGFMNYFEGIRRYPLVYYFHSRRLERSVPYAFYMGGTMAAALRFALPTGHPAAREPHLPALLTGLRDVMAQMRRSLLRDRSREVAPRPVSPEEFAAARRPGGRTDDPWVGRFVALERQLGAVAGVDPQDADTVDAYRRYQQWLVIAHDIDRFVAATAEDLGYDAADLHAPPDAGRSKPQAS